MPSKKDQQNFWSFYPSEPFKNGHFNVRHPVNDSTNKIYKGLLYTYFKQEKNTDRSALFIST